MDNTLIVNNFVICASTWFSMLYSQEDCDSTMRVEGFCLNIVGDIYELGVGVLHQKIWSIKHFIFCIRWSS